MSNYRFTLSRTGMSSLLPTSHFVGLYRVMAFMALCCFTLPSVKAQCTLNCISSINVSLDGNCQAVITPEMVLSNAIVSAPDLLLEVFDGSGNQLAGNLLTVDYLNTAVTYEIYGSACTPSSCWGTINVEAKIQPLLSCPDLSISCAALEFLPDPAITSFSGNCLQSTFDIFLADEQRSSMDCDPGLTGVVTRTYVATDGNGNSTSCEQVIELTRIDFDKLKFPQGTSIIRCSDKDKYIFDENHVPLPWIHATGSGTADYGVPYLFCDTSTGSGTGGGVPGLGTGSGTGSGGGIPGFGTGSGTGSGTPLTPLIPYGGASIYIDGVVEIVPQSNVCSSWVTYSDIPYPQIGCTKKIYRTWEVLEWHCGEEDSYGPSSQIIEIIDDMAPTYDCPQDMTINSGNECGGELEIPGVTNLIDECDHGAEVKMFTPSGLIESNGGEVHLSPGPNLITYTVSDDCYNSSSCSINVMVVDQTMPVAICEQNTVVSISSSGNNLVSAHVLDDGSWDECGAVTSCAVKMNDIVLFRSLTPDTLLNATPYVLASNFVPDCVQDYGNPTYIDGVAYLSEEDLCTPYVEFCCTEIGMDLMVVYRAIDLAGNTSDCMVNVEVQGVAPGISCPADMTVDCDLEYAQNNLGLTFGEAIATGACSSGYKPQETVLVNANSCGIGTLTRTFTLGQAASCKQVIAFEDLNPYDIDDIVWPRDTTILNQGFCSVGQLIPNNLANLHAFPLFPAEDEHCVLLGYDYEDTVTGSGACIEISRNWTVIDWCKQVAGQFVIYENPTPQIIEIQSTIAPVINVTSNPIEFETTSPDCLSGLITVAASAPSSCADGMAWRYVLQDKLANPIITGIGNTLSGEFVAGNYDLVWTVTDGCGLTSTLTQGLTIESKKAPKPICMGSMTLQVLNDYAELEPSMIDVGSFHTCNNPITLAFDSLGTTTLLTYNCEDVGASPVTFPVELWAIDYTSGAAAYCTTQITLVRGDSNCPHMTTVSVGGNLYTEQSAMIEEVNVSMDNSMPVAVTDQDGNYAFQEMPMGGSYELTPVKDVDDANGVSTLDLIMIQRHILDIEPLDSPYKKIAADVDGNHNIDGVDLIELRKLILGIYEKFPQNTSWRFVDSEFVFADESQPWSSEIAETYRIQDLDKNMEIDFIGVKIGDINGDATTNIYDTSTTESRSNRWPLLFVGENEVLQSGEVHNITLNVENYERVSGWQGAIAYDADVIEHIELSVADVLDGEFHYHNLNGLTIFSYMDSDLTDLDNGSASLNLSIKALESVNLAEALSLNSDYTRSEAYRGYSEEVPLLLKLDNRSLNKNLNKILVAVPNPFVEYTTVEFLLEKSGDVLFEFYDAQGRLIYDRTGQFESGRGAVRVDGADLDVQGVIYIKMITENSVSDFKMIKI